MIGQRIKEIRHNNNLTQEELSQGIISRTYLSLIEKGNVQPSTNVLIKLSERLNCSVDDFLNDVSNYEHHDVEILKEISYQEYQLKERNFKVVENFLKKNVLTVQHLPIEERGRVHAIYGKYYHAMGKRDNATKHLTEAIELLSSVSIHQNYIDTILLKVEMDISEKRFFEALDELDAIYKKVIKFDWNLVDVLRIYYSYSVVYFEFEQYFTANRYYNKFEQLSNQLDIEYKRNESNTLIYKILYRLNDTENLLQRVELDERCIGRLFMTIYYYDRGNIRKAKELFETLPKESEEIQADKITCEIYEFLNERLLMI